MLETAGAGLKPLNTTAIVDAAVEHVRAEPLLYYGITAPIAFPLGALALYYFDLVREYRGAPAGYAPRLIGASASIAVLFHLRFLAHGAVAWAVERRLQGLEATAAGAWRAAMGRALPLGLAGVAFWSAVAVSAPFALLPVVVTFSLLILGPAVALHEGTGPVRTLRRTISLGWLEIGRALSMGAILLLGAAILVGSTGLALQAALGLARTAFAVDTTWLASVVDWRHASFTLGVVVAAFALLEPVKTVAFVLLYVDRRVRTEGFDLRRKVDLVIEHEARARAVAGTSSDGELEPVEAAEAAA